MIFASPTQQARLGNRAGVDAYLFSAGNLQHWERDGTVVSATLFVMQGIVAEQSVIFEGGTWKMWFRSGWTADHAEVYYATSPDGVVWTIGNGGAPVVTGYIQVSVSKIGSTYYLSGSPATGNAQIDLYSSSDETNFTLLQAAVISKGGSGAWDELGVFNSFLFLDDTGASPYIILYEGESATGTFFTGLATAAAVGGPYTKYAGNPIITSAYGAASGAWMTKDGGVYHIWLHETAVGGNVVPLQIRRFSSTDLHTWVRASTISLGSVGLDEDGPLHQGGPADPCLVEVAGSTYLFYAAANTNAEITGGSHIKRASIAMTLAQVIASAQQENQFLQTTVSDDYIAPNGTSILAHTTSNGNAYSRFRAFGSDDTFAGTINSNNLTIAGVSGQVSGFTIAGGQSNGYWSIDITLPAGSDGGIVFRATDANNWYQLDLNQATQELVIYKREAGSITAIATQSVTVTADVAYTLTILCDGPFMQGYINGKSFVSITDAFNKTATIVGPSAGGTISANVVFDNFMRQVVASP